jgi:hypothetical protein
VCAVPPPGTDPVTLTDAQLAHYAMLPRPRGVSVTSAAYTNWESLVRASRHRVCSEHRSTGSWGSMLPAHQTGPLWRLYGSEDGAVNQSGVIAVGESGSYYSQVEAEWTIPNMIVREGNSATTGAWVGLDGFQGGVYGGDGNLLQAGFGEVLDFPSRGFLTRSCYTFWEDYPDLTINYTDNHVSCGDDVYATVIQNQRPPAKNASVYIIDKTNGWWFGLNPISPAELPWPPNGSTASWIVEQNVGPLANFGAITFNNAKAAAFGYEDPIGTWPTNALRQWDCSPFNTPTCTVANDTMAYPGPIHNGLFFNDYWVRYGKGLQ